VTCQIKQPSGCWSLSPIPMMLSSGLVARSLGGRMLETRSRIASCRMVRQVASTQRFHGARFRRPAVLSRPKAQRCWECMTSGSSGWAKAGSGKTATSYTLISCG